MESARAIPVASELKTLLENMKPFEHLWIPGPLVQFFKNLTCFSPFENGYHGYVTPILPPTPTTWSQYHYHLPNIAALFSRLRTICSVANRENMIQQLFMSDVNGPFHCVSMFGRQFSNLMNERDLVQSPGLGLALPGNLKLWNIPPESLVFPHGLDGNGEEQDSFPSWGTFLQMDSCTDWFDSLSRTMAEYCRFWRGSVPLSDCSPKGSAAGAVKCTAHADSDMFRNIVWTNQTGKRKHSTHGNSGHYTLKISLTLNFSASTTIRDLPKEMLCAASTYCVNLLVNGDDDAVRKGHFWDIYPDVARNTSISTLFASRISIVRDYHSDTSMSLGRN